MAASAEGNETDPNLTPLLDVVLQLIMFFMITVNFVRVEPLSKLVKLPVAQSAVVMDDSGEDWIYLNVGEDGKLIVPGQDLEDDPKDKPGTKLLAYLLKRKQDLAGVAQYRGHKGELRITVIVSAHGDVPSQRVWEILEIAETAGLRTGKMRAYTRAIE